VGVSKTTEDLSRDPRRPSEVESNREAQGDESHLQDGANQGTAVSGKRAVVQFKLETGVKDIGKLRKL